MKHLEEVEIKKHCAFSYALIDWIAGQLYMFKTYWCSTGILLSRVNQFID